MIFIDFSMVLGPPLGPETWTASKRKAGAPDWIVHECSYQFDAYLIWFLPSFEPSRGFDDCLVHECPYQFDACIMWFLPSFKPSRGFDDTCKYADDFDNSLLFFLSSWQRIRFASNCWLVFDLAFDSDLLRVPSARFARSGVSVTSQFK